MLTLYTTPVIYLYLDRFSHWCRRVWGKQRRGTVQETVSSQER